MRQLFSRMRMQSSKRHRCWQFCPAWHPYPEIRAKTVRRETNPTNESTLLGDNVTHLAANGAKIQQQCGSQRYLHEDATLAVALSQHPSKAPHSLLR